MKKKEIEKIFQVSNCNDELFDAFQKSIIFKECDVETYKILLANPRLTVDELKMYSEQLAKMFNMQAFEIFSWTGAVIEAKTDLPYYLEESIEYYQKAWQENQKKSDPLLSMLSMYNYELDMPYNNTILSVVENGAETVEEKRSVYYALAKLFEKKGNIEKKRKYMILAEKSPQ